MVAVGGVFIIIEGNGAGVGGLRAEAGWREIMIALQVIEVKSFMGKLWGRLVLILFCWRKPRFPRIIRSILTGI